MGWRNLLLSWMVVLLLLAAGGLGYAMVVEPSSIHVQRRSITLKAKDLAGRRIAVISDLHGGAPYIDSAKIDRIVALTNAENPDVVLLTGDYVIQRVVGGRHMKIEEMARRLQHLRARQGVYAVIGNHDRWENAARVTAAFEQAGIPVLENRRLRLEGFDLVGIGDDYTRAARPGQALRGLEKGRAAICFTHSPDVFHNLSPACSLTIAGHTHGGQVRLPLLGRPAVGGVSHFGQAYAIGVIREGGRTLFVSPGIGTSGLPVRFGVPPEISLLELR